MSQMIGAVAAHCVVAWRYCFRARALVGIALLGVLVLVLAALMASFSLRQPLVVALDVGYSGFRILGAFLAVLWVQDVFFRDIDKRILLSAFSYPVPRFSYVIGRFAGVFAVIALAVIIWSVGLTALTYVADWGYEGSSRPVLGVGFFLAMTGLLVDLAVIAAFTLLVVSLSETPLMPLFGGLSFALVARSIGDVISYLDFSLDPSDPLRVNLLPLVQALRWAMPDLGRLDVRPVILYGQSFDMVQLANTYIACLGYVLLLVLLAVRNYEKREFS